MSDTSCCGCNLDDGAKAIAMLDILLAFSTLLSNLFFNKFNGFLAQYFDNTVRYNDDLAFLIQQFRDGTLNEFHTNVIVVVSLALLLTFTTLDIGVSALLLHGSNSKNITSCRWWVRLRILLLLMFIVYFFVEMGRQRLFLYGVVDILLIFYRIYCLSTVDSFIKQLEKANRIRNQRRNSIVVPHVQVITPDGSLSFSSPFPPGEHTLYPETHAASIHRANNIANLNGRLRDTILQARDSVTDSHPYTRLT